MQRDIALQPLSHRHHNELLGCLLIKKGVSNKADKKILKDFALRFWDEDLQRHINDEENILLPHLSGHPVSLQYKQIIKRDYDMIRLLAERMRFHDDGYTLFNVFASLVEEHIRFKERVVFGKIREQLSEPQRAQLQSSLQSLSGKKCTDYPVKFWE